MEEVQFHKLTPENQEQISNMLQDSTTPFGTVWKVWVKYPKECTKKLALEGNKNPCKVAVSHNDKLDTIEKACEYCKALHCWVGGKLFYPETSPVSNDPFPLDQAPRVSPLKAKPKAEETSK